MIKKTLIILFILFCSGFAYAAQTTVNTSSDTFKTAWDRQQAMNTELYSFPLGDLLANGTVPLTANWDLGAFTITGTQFISDIADGTAPFVSTSTTIVTNFNADLLDGESAIAFEDADAAIVKSDENETITGSWALGTPSALVGTNISGTAASLTAGTVTGFTPASGSLTLSGADALTVTTTAATSITLPTSGILGVQFSSIAVTDLTDSATPSVLTIAETTNHCISNYKSTGADHVFTMPAAHIAGNIIFAIGDEFQVDIEPNTGDLFYLNGTAMAADEHIQNTGDTLGERIVGYCVNINGTLRWMFYSSDAAWVEETP